MMLGVIKRNAVHVIVGLCCHCTFAAMIYQTIGAVVSLAQAIQNNTQCHPVAIWCQLILEVGAVFSVCSLNQILFSVQYHTD